MHFFRGLVEFFIFFLQIYLDFGIKKKASIFLRTYAEFYS